MSIRILRRQKKARSPSTVGNTIKVSPAALEFLFVDGDDDVDGDPAAAAATGECNGVWRVEKPVDNHRKSPVPE